MLVHLADGYKPGQVPPALAAKIQSLPDAVRRSLTWDQGPEMRDSEQVGVAADVADLLLRRAQAVAARHEMRTPMAVVSPEPIKREVASPARAGYDLGVALRGDSFGQPHSRRCRSSSVSGSELQWLRCVTCAARAPVSGTTCRGRRRRPTGGGIRTSSGCGRSCRAARSESTPAPPASRPAKSLAEAFVRDRALAQVCTTTGTIIGRRRCVSLTHLPSRRRTTCCNR